MIKFEYMESEENILEYRLGDREFTLDEIYRDVMDYDRVLINNGIKDIYGNIIRGGYFWDYKIELEELAENMWKKLGNTTRKKINRFRRECKYSYIIIENATEEQIIEFCNECSYALSLKGHNWNNSRERVRALFSISAYIITYITDEQGRKLAGHGWFVDGNNVCPNKSFSKMREHSKQERIYALANVMLNWLDIEAFGKKGYKYMFMGGLGSAEYELDDEAQKIACFKNELIKETYREKFIYYCTIVDCISCRKNMEIVQKNLEGIKRRCIIYGYGSLGIAARLACFNKGVEVVQIVDRAVSLKIDYVEADIMPADGNSFVIVAAVDSAVEIKNICRNKGYDECDILLPYI